MPRATRPSPERQAWLDYAKAIGIALVVFGHASRSIGRTEGLLWSPALQSADAVIYAFHMPLFFMLAGYAAGLVRNGGSASFGRALLWGVAVPYLVWSLVWIGLKLALPDAANVPLTLADLVRIPVAPVEHMWFLYHLFFLRVAWFAIDRLDGLGENRQSWSLLGAILASGLLMTVAPVHEPLAAFLRNFAVYGLGLVWLPAVLRHLEAGRSLSLIAVGGSLCLASLAVPAEGMLALLLPAVGGSLIVVGIARALPPPATLPMRAFAFLGEASIAIYVLHLIVGAGARVALARTGLLDEGTLLVAATVLGLVLPAMAYWLALTAGTMTGRPIVRYAGLGTAARSTYLPFETSPVVARVAS